MTHYSGSYDARDSQEWAKEAQDELTGRVTELEAPPSTLELRKLVAAVYRSNATISKQLERIAEALEKQ